MIGWEELDVLIWFSGDLLGLDLDLGLGDSGSSGLRYGRGTCRNKRYGVWVLRYRVDPGKFLSEWGILM